VLDGLWKRREREAERLGGPTVGFLYLHITAIKGNEVGSDLLGASERSLASLSWGSRQRNVRTS
jgi:hypothetical protein